jgi:hypothetical protein
MWMDFNGTNFALTSTKCDGGTTDCDLLLHTPGNAYTLIPYLQLGAAGRARCTSSADHLMECTNNAGQGVRWDFTTNSYVTLTDEAGGALNLQLHTSGTFFISGKWRLLAPAVGIMALEDSVAGAGTVIQTDPVTKTCADSGDGNPSTCGGAYTIRSRIIQLVCSDADGCELTLAETNWDNDQVGEITLIGPPANTVTIADSAGVVELVGGVSWVGEANDTLNIAYDGARTTWVETSRTDSKGDISATQSLAAAGAITSTDKYNPVVGSGGAVTLTSTPSIVAGAAGQELCVIGTSDANTITLQDETTLAGTTLELAGDVSMVLGIHDTICLVYYNSHWLEVSRSDNDDD